MNKATIECVVFFLIVVGVWGLLIPDLIDWAVETKPQPRLTILTDESTGVQYLSSSSGITPRLTASGDVITISDSLADFPPQKEN